MLAARLKRVGEAPGALAGRFSNPFQLPSPPIPAPIRPLACIEREFRILSSAIRRMISPAGKSICLIFIDYDLPQMSDRKLWRCLVLFWLRLCPLEHG
jgi:hypothetical protein